MENKDPANIYIVARFKDGSYQMLLLDKQEDVVSYMKCGWRVFKLNLPEISSYEVKLLEEKQEKSKCAKELKI